MNSQIHLSHFHIDETYVDIYYVEEGFPFFPDTSRVSISASSDYYNRWLFAYFLTNVGDDDEDEE